MLDPEKRRYQKKKRDFWDNFWMIIWFCFASLFIGFMILSAFRMEQYPYLSSRNQSLATDCCICTAIALGGILGWLVMLVQRLRRRTVPDWLTIIPFCLYIICGCWLCLLASINPEVSLSQDDSSQSTVSVNAGSIVTFVNPSDGVPQVLCIGRDQHCASTTESSEGVQNAPSELRGGLSIDPGQSVDVVFRVQGDYQITSQSTAHMNIP